MVEAKLDGFVYVGGGGDAGFEHREGFIANEGVDTGSDKARSFVNDDGFFLHAMGDFDTDSNGFVGGVRGANDFHQAHFGDGIEEVHADAAIAGNDNVREIADGERRSIAGEDSVGLCEFVEDGEKFEFHFEFFGGGFDDQVGAADGLVNDVRGGNQRESGGAGRGIDFAARYALLEGAANPVEGFGDNRIRD